MKKTILSLVFISLFSLLSYAQGNLQFNQVKLIYNVEETVPQNKVWKVVSFWQVYTPTVSSLNYQSCGSEGHVSPFMVNSNIYHMEKNGYSGFSALHSFPLWLPSGTTIRTVCPKDFLSVIEFNIIP